MTADLARTPLHDEHEALGGRLVPFAGWRLPVQYSGIKKEHQAVREACGLFDVSHMGELSLTGPQALATADYLVTNDVTRLEDGQALYTVCCNDQGTILDDLIVYRKGPQDILIVCNASNREKISAHVGAVAAERGATFADLSDATSLIALQGPKAVDTLRDAGGGALTELGFFRHAQGQVGGKPCMVARTGYTGEDGFEIFCANEDAVAIWRALLAAGEAHGIAPAGLGARDTLRLEATLSLYGNEIDETTHPFEARLGWVVKLDAGDFIGKEALERIKAQPLERKLVGFVMRGRGIARHGYPLLDENGERVGEVTSGSPSPTTGDNIGLGYVPVALAKRGTRLGVEIRGKVVDAEVVKTPFYKRAE